MLKKLLALYIVLLTFALPTFGQVTVTAPGTYSYAIRTAKAKNLYSFSVRNNNTYPISIAEINSQQVADSVGIYDLWYTTVDSDVSKRNVNVAAPAWTFYGRSAVVRGGNGIKTLFSGIRVMVPPGKLMRLAIVFDDTINNRIISTPYNYFANGDGPIFSNGGIDLFAGNNDISPPLYGSRMTLQYNFNFIGSIKCNRESNGANNAGITSIIPPPTASCEGIWPIKVKIANNGTNIINSVNVWWQVDSDAPQSLLINGAIRSASDTEIVLTTVNYTNTDKRIKVWTSLPNNQQDTVNIDDTLVAEKLRAGLHGIYTVGTGGDFATLEEAANTLNTYGICDNVTLNIMRGQYLGQVILKNIPNTNANRRVLIKSQSGNHNDVSIEFRPALASGTVVLENASYITIRDLTIVSNSDTPVTTNSRYGSVVLFQDSASYDSIVNCRLLYRSEGRDGTSACIKGTSTKSLSGLNNIAIIGNILTGGYSGINWTSGDGRNNQQGYDNVFERNIINNPTYYGIYISRSNRTKLKHNRISIALNFEYNQNIGMYLQNSYETEITANYINIEASKITTAIGLLITANNQVQNLRSTVKNNVIAINSLGQTNVTGIQLQTSSYFTVYNNSVNVQSFGTQSRALFFNSTSVTNGNNEFLNNVFSNKSTTMGNAMEFANTNIAFINKFDYNNYYSTTGNLIQSNTPAFRHKNLTEWINASGRDSNSISYEPGFTNNNNLRPDVANSNSWSLNGRGVHIAENDRDFNDSNRATLRQNGVPDIGAYEFTPNVEPPLCNAEPSVVSLGDTQRYTFGEQLVATLVWNKYSIITPVVVRQYSGEKAPGIAQAAGTGGNMYFYTSILPVGNTSTNYNLDITLNYMNIWRGTIQKDTAVRMAFRSPQFQWQVYNGSMSNTDVRKKTINADSTRYTGIFTGLENGIIPSSFVNIKDNKRIICTGESTTLIAAPSDGTSYIWYNNGNTIPNANAATLTTSAAGDYSVQVTRNGNNVKSQSTPVSVIASPNPTLQTTNALLYCPGNNLTLKAAKGDAYSYQWLRNGIVIPGSTSDNLIIPTAGEYRVRITNAACSTISDSAVINVGPPNVSLGNDTIYCEQKNVMHILKSGYPGAKHTWSTGDTSANISLKLSGTIWVKVDAGPNCIGTDTISVVIDSLPRTSGISYLKNGTQYSFFASNPKYADSYLWIFSDGTTSVQEKPTKTIQGSLHVKLVLINDCGTDTSILGYPLTVSAQYDTELFKMYPNPASDKLYVENTGTANWQKIEIVDYMGRIVYSLQPTEYKITIDTKPLRNGHYIIRIVTSEGMYSSKFQILK